jgi:hypothetical protein
MPNAVVAIELVIEIGFAVRDVSDRGFISGSFLGDRRLAGTPIDAQPKFSNTTAIQHSG